MTEEKKEGETVQQMLASAGKRLFGRDLIVVACACAGVAYATLSVKNSFAQSNQAQIDAGMKIRLDPVIEEVRLLKLRADDKEHADAAFKMRVEARFDSQETDIRALYRAMMTGERQPRLEHPAPPVPDAGKVYDYDIYAKDAGR